MLTLGEIAWPEAPRFVLASTFRPDTTSDAVDEVEVVDGLTEYVIKTESPGFRPTKEYWPFTVVTVKLVVLPEEYTTVLAANELVAVAMPVI